MKLDSIFLILLMVCVPFLPSILSQPSLYTKYITEYTAFYPSKAVSMGKHDLIFEYEERTLESVQKWVEFNEDVISELKQNTKKHELNQAINNRLLRMQIQEELEIWKEEQPHMYSPKMYTELISSVFSDVLEADYLTNTDISDLLCQRLLQANALSKAARSNLKKSAESEVDAGKIQIEEIRQFIMNDLLTILENRALQASCEDFNDWREETIAELGRLKAFLEEDLTLDSETQHSVLGRNKYALHLMHYVDQDISPEKLAAMALSEIKDVREKIKDQAVVYLSQKYPNEALPEDEELIIARAFSDMEKDAPVDGEDYLKFWNELAVSATKFVEENSIATLPDFPTLKITNAPESAGPAARIGWVSSAAPFDPNPVTTLYLPSIPDSFPEKERKEFWSSFNKPFNRMIIIHELIPGHYMQIKISRETPHPIRLWFSYGPYFEGWASFTEEVVLDAGWDEERPLTHLAHLRKRLENANRAYTSVMVHCNGWTEEEVMEFSTQTSLLAPQFAKSLWGRLMRSPMQMTSYYYGGSEFRALLAHEKERLGKDFDLKFFMDTIMKTGPIAIEDFKSVFSSSD